MVSRKISALVVDDDSLIRRVEATLLARYGLETKVAENGREAVDLFVAGNSFDLVLMDMQMPVMDGPEVFLFASHLLIFTSNFIFFLIFTFN